MKVAGWLAACVVSLLASPCLAQAPAGAVSFRVDHVRGGVGHVRVDICTRDTFLKAECPFFGAAAAVNGVTEVIVEGVPPGLYAAQVYHDRNDDHAVNRSPRLGIPREEIGFSNNAVIGLRGPSWSKAAFTHTTADQALSVKLHRYEAP